MFNFRHILNVFIKVHVINKGGVSSLIRLRITSHTHTHVKEITECYVVQ